MALILLPQSLSIRVVSPKNSFTYSRKSSYCQRDNLVSPTSSISTNWAEELRSKSLKLALSSALALGICLSASGSVDAKVAVNKPELLPKEFSTVIDVAGFLSAGQENRLRQEIADLEEDTGFKLRLLAQNYPETPGLAIRDFWQVDDRTIVFVVDPTFGRGREFFGAFKQLRSKDGEEGRSHLRKKILNKNQGKTSEGLYIKRSTRSFVKAIY